MTTAEGLTIDAGSIVAAVAVLEGAGLNTAAGDAAATIVAVMVSTAAIMDTAEITITDVAISLEAAEVGLEGETVLHHSAVASSLLLRLLLMLVLPTRRRLPHATMASTRTKNAARVAATGVALDAVAISEEEVAAVSVTKTALNALATAQAPCPNAAALHSLAVAAPMLAAAQTKDSLHVVAAAIAGEGEEAAVMVTAEIPEMCALSSVCLY